MARALDLLPFEFLARHAVQRGGQWSLAEVERNGAFDCTFLRRDAASGRARCAIYTVRPAQCRTWPFWPENLSSRADWRSAGERCPGIDGPGAAQFSAAEIDALRRETPRA